MCKDGKERVLVGHVSVDSGQIIIVDPCYLSEWDEGNSDSEASEFSDEFMGALEGPAINLDDIDQETLELVDLDGLDLDTEEGNRFARVRISHVGFAKAIRKEAGRFSYLGVCGALETTLFAEIAFKRAGVVASGSGLGDGHYPVYATIEDCGERLGKRVAKLEIVFLPHPLERQDLAG